MWCSHDGRFWATQQRAEDRSSKFLRNATRLHSMPHQQRRSKFRILQMDLNLSVLLLLFHLMLSFIEPEKVQLNKSGGIFSSLPPYNQYGWVPLPLTFTHCIPTSSTYIFPACNLKSTAISQAIHLYFGTPCPLIFLPPEYGSTSPFKFLSLLHQYNQLYF